MIKPLVSPGEINKMIKKGSISPQEHELIMHRDLSESRIQQTCRTIFQGWCLEHNIDGLFVQIDNGGAVGNKIKKKLEGTISGFPDVMLLIGERSKQIFIEFKEIGGKVKKEQLEMQEALIRMGFPCHIMNNTIFFKKTLEDFKSENYN